MQRRHVALGNNPLPPTNISQSSLKTPVCGPHPPTHVRTISHAHTHRTSQNTITSLSLLVWKTVKHWNSPPPPQTPSSVGDRGWRGGAVAPFVPLRVVHLDRVEELVSIEAAHGVDDVAQHGRTCVAARTGHTTQHPPLITSGVIHLHTAERVGAVEAANNKQFAW